MDGRPEQCRHIHVVLIVITLLLQTAVWKFTVRQADNIRAVHFIEWERDFYCVFVIQ